MRRILCLFGHRRYWSGRRRTTCERCGKVECWQPWLYPWDVR